VPLHDLVIRTMAEYLVGMNTTLKRLQWVNARFYGLRNIFREHITGVYLVCHETEETVDYLCAAWGKKGAEEFLAVRRKSSDGLRHPVGKLFIIKISS